MPIFHRAFMYGTTGDQIKSGQEEKTMKQNKLMSILLALLLMAAAAFVPALAEDDLPEPVEYEETDTLVLPDGPETSAGWLYVYVTGQEKLGIDMTAKNQNVSAVVLSDVFSDFGGAAVMADAGTADLSTGNIHGGYGIFAYLRNGGTINADVEDIFAGNDTGLDVLIPGSGTLNFEGGSIFSGSYGVSLVTGSDEDYYDLDPLPDDDDGWIDPIEDDWTDPIIPDDPDEDDEPDPQEPAEGTAEAVISFVSIDAGDTGADIELNNASTVTLTGEAVWSDNKGVEIALSDQGGTVTVEAPIIDAENQGLVINAAAGDVTVKNSDHIGADSAVEITNDGGTVSLPEGGALDGNSGIHVEATGGTTTVNTGDISAQNYGVSVRTYDQADYEPFDPDEDADGSEAQDAGTESGEASGAKPVVKITVDGEITDQFDMTPPEGDWDFDPEPFEPEEFGSGSLTKDAADDDAEEPEASGAEGSVGIVVAAETESDIEISVSEQISMSYGNEVEAYDKSKVNVSVGEDVITDYGNRIGSADGADVKFTIGGDIYAGGKALETYADSGNIEVSVGNIAVEESDDGQDTAGIYATSEGTGKTVITAEGGILVNSESGETETSGLDLYNAGGEITIKTGSDVTAKGPGAVGMVLTDLSEDGSPVKTNVEITGSLTGTSEGLVFDTTEDTDGKADILVTDTISGSQAGVIVSADADPENLDLTVWQIKSGNGHAAVTPDGSAAEEIEPEIKYIIKIDPDSEDKIEAVYEDGSEPETSHGFIYQKEDRRVYVRGINGYEVTEAYNGKENQTPLKFDENNGLFYLEVPNGGAIWLTTEKSPVPVPPPHYDDDDDDLIWLYGIKLPGTGFSASRVTMLPARTKGPAYRTTGLTLQIPGLDVSETIVMVPEENGNYPVEWLGSDIGLLEQSSLPGKGVTVLTGHNHLNTTEAGPFLFLGRLEAGDHIMVNDKRNNMSVYKVYANEKIAADAFADIADEVRANALVLITCEDEAVDGGYLNRRVILAEPM